jgi:D-arabinonate dehydratase
MGACAAEGFKAVKMKIGKGRAEEDRDRVRATREAIGPGVELMVDAVNAWSDAKYAIRVARMIEEYDVRWLEEPVMPDNVEMLAQIARATDIPIAGCEFEAGRWAYRNFVEHKAFDILMPDVNTVGGISEWLKIAGMAACHEVPVSPHRASEIHAQLAGATVGVFIIEYQAPSQCGTVVFDRILREPLSCRDGVVEISQTPGVGTVFDWDAVAKYEV